MGIPKAKGPRDVAHLDTNLLRGAIDADDAREIRESARAILNKKNSSFGLRASLPALGELTLVMAQTVDVERFDAAMRRLHRLIRTGQLTVFGLDHDGERATMIAQEIEKAEPRIGATDALVIACAFLDPLAGVLYSTDEFVTWREIEKLAKKWETRVSSPP